MNKTFAIVLMLAMAAVVVVGCSQAEDNGSSTPAPSGSAPAGGSSSATGESPSTGASSSSSSSSEGGTAGQTSTTTPPPPPGAVAQTEPPQERKMAKQYSAPPPMKIDANKTYIATIDTTAGTMVAELWPKVAPQTVNSFVFLAREGYYDGVIFHRVIPGFMIQGGDPTGQGTGGPGYRLKAEFNDTKHEKGILSMARTQDPNSAGSQFFVMHGTAPYLDNQYTVFGKVTQGLEVIDKIVNAPRDSSNDRPKNPTKINKVTIEEK